MEFNIKKADYSDISQICAAMARINKLIGSAGIFIADDDNYIHSHINEEGQIYMALNKNKLSAFIIIDIPGEKPHNLALDLKPRFNNLLTSAHMDSIVVLPEYRGMGLQRTLLEHSESALSALGFLDFFATVHPDNNISLKNFLALGYTCEATRLKYGGHLRHILHKSSNLHTALVTKKKFL